MIPAEAEALAGAAPQFLAGRIAIASREPLTKKTRQKMTTF